MKSQRTGVWTTVKMHKDIIVEARKKKLISQLVDEGFSYRDVEQILGINPGTAYRIHKKSKGVS